MNPSQKNHRGAKVRARVATGLFALLTFSSLSAAQATSGAQRWKQIEQASTAMQGWKQLEVKLRQTGQSNCRNSDGATVYLKLELEITNVTQTKVIVSKRIGSKWYGTTVARDERAFSEGSFESDWNIDWFPTESDLENPPENAPPAEFTILEPGKSFFAEGKAVLPAQVDSPSPSSDLLPPGNHVLQLDLGTWFHVSAAEPFRDSWKKFGNLVYRPTKSEFLHFRVPPIAEFTDCRH